MSEIYLNGKYVFSFLHILSVLVQDGLFWLFMSMVSIINLDIWLFTLTDSVKLYINKI